MMSAFPTQSFLSEALLISYQMFINWAHYIIPKSSFVLSYISNPLFIYLIHSTNHSILGSYRYLLFFFAIFNMIASLADLLISVVCYQPLSLLSVSFQCVFGYQNAFVTFIADGPFSERSQFGQDAVAYRCAFISGTYGILNVHFIFRYMILERGDLITRYFMPYGLILAITYVIFHWFIWVWITIKCMYSVPEMRDHIREAFQELYHEEIDTINLMAGVFSEVSPEVIHRSWAAILSFTFIASYSMVIYFVLGYNIITGIKNSVGTMSQKTAQMQKQLFKALTIQTVIPICVSFLPCTLSFYGASLNFDFINWVYWGSAVAVSMFPFLDPMAIIFFLPVLRKRLGFRIGVVSVSSTSN